MHVEMIHFEKVFDAHAGRGDFSFESNGQVRYGVKLQRGMVPRAGSTYLVAFAESDDWSTVLGWLDLHTETMALSERLRHTMWSDLGSITLFGPVFLGAALLFGGPSAALAVLLAICSFAGFRLCRVVARNRLVRKALRNAQVKSGKAQSLQAVRPS